MTASTPLEVRTEKSAYAYTVQEPSEHGDADSQLSPSVDTDTPATRYTMAEMEAYMQLVRNDREQVQQEVQNLQAGFDCLFHAMKKPAEEIEVILEDQTKTTAMVEEIEKFKQEVSKSLTMLTVKCDMLDKHVPELKEKLEYAIHTISVAQQSIDAANLNSPAPSERSTSIGDFRFAGVSVEEIRQLHERSKRESNQMKKDYQDFKSGMMELQAIRARLNEGIERNGISDLKELNREQLQAHERRQSDGRRRDVTCSLDLLAQYLREAVDRARFGSASPELYDAAPKLIRTQSPDVAQKGSAAKFRDAPNGASKPVRSRTPKSHQVRLSCEETSPARSLSRGSSTSSRARSLDYAKNNGTGNGTNRPGTARATRPLPRYEARSRIDTGRNTSTLARNSVGGTGAARSSFTTRRNGLGASMGCSDASPHSEASMRPVAVSASPSRSTTSLAPPSRTAAMYKASINRLSQPRAAANRVRSSSDSFKGDLSASTKSAIPRRSADRGRSASTKRPNSRGAQAVRTSSQASTTCLSQDHATTDDMAESSMCDSMASGVEDTASMPLTMVPASTPAAVAQYGNPPGSMDLGSATDADADMGSSLLQGMPMLHSLDRHSPCASNEQSLSSAHSVPNPHLTSPGDKRRENNGIPPLSDGLPALVTTLDSPDVTSSRSPGAQRVKSMRQAYSESQDRTLRQVAESIDHGREPIAPFQEPSDAELEPITTSTSQLESLHLDLDGVRDIARNSDGADQSDNPVRSVRAWLHSGSDVGSEGDVAGGTGSVTGSVIGSGLPNGLPGGISPRGLLNGMGQSVASPLCRSPHKSSPHTSSPSPRHPIPSPRNWDVDQPLNAASLVPGGSHADHSRDGGDDAPKSNYASIPAPSSADRRQSLSRLAPVVEEPGASASVDSSGDILGSWRHASTRPMQSSAEWLHRQASLKENNNGNMGHPSPSKQSKMRSFSTDHSTLESHARHFQTRGYSDYNHDAFSIDSKDSCKPEKCESPDKSQRHSVKRNGQGTDPPKYQNSQLEQRIAQLVNRK